MAGQRNVAHDTAAAGVPVILLVEDNVRFYSSFLPTIYTELIRQSERLISEGVNLSHKLVRMRARPKILLTSSFEEAWEAFTAYRPHLLGLISDIEFPRLGTLTREAGFELARMVRAAAPDLPILLQSSRAEFAPGARAVGAQFLMKYSETLLSDLQRFMVEHFAFGDFVFRNAAGDEVARATDLKSLEEKLRTVPAESIAYHGARNHFSSWLRARTEFALAHQLRPRRLSDYASIEDLRHDLVDSIAEYRREQGETLVADFDRAAFDPRSNFFARIGGGSLGGKARGLAFVRYLLNYHRIGRRFPGVRIAVPPAVVLATDCFDRYLAMHGLTEFALRSPDDDEMLRRFLAAPLPEDVVLDLRAFLAAVEGPLAVRSSSLLEDSQYQPFSGVYETFMLPNNDPDPAARFEQLSQAIRRVYASTFTQRAKTYLRATPYRLEEEKMAVVIQTIAGARHGPRFYPDFAGVARSTNFYPAPPLRSEDGVAAVALGLGRTVVEGERCFLFCPRYPQHPIHASSVDEILSSAQQEFWALDLEAAGGGGGPTLRETRYGLGVAEVDGTLDALGSTYSAENGAIYDGLARAGTRLVTFAAVLKHGVFPLAPILEHLLEVGSRGMNRPAEIEFAVRLSRDPAIPHQFGFLQMRPLVLQRETEDLEVEAIPLGELVCRSSSVLGNGVVDTLRDVVVVDYHRYERSHSVAAAEAVAHFNAELAAAGRPYLLIGVGRWGSRDPWLGIPVTWDQIAGARVIVEAGFRDFRVTPSQGSHFFQNLTSFQVGYFTVNADAGEGFVDWAWIQAQHARRRRGPVRHLQFREPLVAKMNGRRNQGVIYKPGEGLRG